MGVRLPAEYQEVEFLGSTVVGSPNRSWIDTLIYPTNETNIRLVYSGYYQNPNPWQSAKCFVDAREGNNRYELNDATFNFGTSWNSRWNNNVPPPESGTLEIIGGKLYFDGVLKLNKSDQIFTLNSSLALFTSRDDSTRQNQFNLISFKAWQASDLIGDFVPCYRKSDDKPGLYDLVTDAFFTNQGTVEFVVGPDVIDSISPLMVAWRRMLMRKPPLDTSPRIAEYGKYCGGSNVGLVKNANWCYTDWYDFPKPHGNITYQQLTGMNESHTFQEINTDTGERTWNYPNISITSNYDKVRFSIKISLLSTCYFVRDDTGEIIFAGRDSIYYGHKNISEIT